MPRYFFDIESGSTCARDDRGTDLQHRVDVAREAVVVLFDVLRNRSIAQDTPPRCLVRGENGRPVFMTVLRITTEWSD